MRCPDTFLFLEVTPTAIGSPRTLAGRYGSATKRPLTGGDVEKQSPTARAALRTSIAVAFLALTAGCEPAGSEPPEGELVSEDVAVSVFSGRESPTYTLSTEARAEVGAFLSEASEHLVEAEESHESLGFRGFVVTGSDGVEYRITPDEIVREGAQGVHSAPSSGDEYLTIFDDISGAFDADVANVVPAPEG